jgi:ribonucleotide reductase beta subunit family protein with ferritin-like domain
LFRKERENVNFTFFLKNKKLKDGGDRVSIKRIKKVGGNLVLVEERNKKMSDELIKTTLSSILHTISDDDLTLLIEEQLVRRNEKFSRTLERVSVQRIVRNGFVLAPTKPLFDDRVAPTLPPQKQADTQVVTVPMTVHKEQEEEPLLVDRDCENVSKRYVMFPLDPEHVRTYEMYKKQIACFWIAEEIDTKDDVVHWEEQLTPSERGYISTVLAFFAASDGIVTENLAARFLSEVKSAEVRAFYSFQIGMEAIHSEVYSMLLDTYIRDAGERDRLFSAITTIESVGRKALWSRRWIESEQTTFAERLIAFAAVEGIFFSSSFCAIYWLKKRGLMPGLCFSNELISRDEGLHCDFACHLYTNFIRNKLSRSRILEIICEAVECEIGFVEESLPRNLHGMNAASMAIYVKFVADRLLRALGQESHYAVRNPFDFMDMIGMPGKTNFFEKVVSAYQKTGVMAGARKRMLASSSNSSSSEESVAVSSSGSLPSLSPSPSSSSPTPSSTGNTGTSSPPASSLSRSGSLPTPSSTSKWQGKTIVVTEDIDF